MFICYIYRHLCFDNVYMPNLNLNLSYECRKYWNTRFIAMHIFLSFLLIVRYMVLLNANEWIVSEIPLSGIKMVDHSR